MAWRQVLIHIDKKHKHKISTPKKFMMFSWEEPDPIDAKKLTPEDWKELNRKYGG